MAKITIFLTIILITINFSIQCGGKSKDILFTNDNPNTNVTQSDINEASNFGFPNKFNGTYNACECKYDLLKKNITVTYELYYKETKSYSLIICSFNYNNILNSNSLSSLQSCGDNYSFKYTYSSKTVYQYFFSFRFIYIPNILPPIVINTQKPAPIVIVNEPEVKIQNIVIEPKEKEIVTVIDNSKNPIITYKNSTQPSSVIYNPRTPDKVTIIPGSGSGSVSSVNNTNSTSTGNCNGNNGSGSTSGIVVIPTPAPVVPAKQIIIIEEKWEKRTLVTTYKKTTITGDFYVNMLLNFLFKTKYSCLLKANLNKNFKVTCGIGKDGFKQASSPKLACEGGSDYFVACPCAAA
jgi:hypothetical protein